MSTDVTREEMERSAPRKVRSPATLAAINAVVAMAAGQPAPRRERTIRVSVLREALAESVISGLLTADDAMRLAGLVDALERAHPGAERVPLDSETGAELERMHDAHLAEVLRQAEERDRARWPQCAAGPCAAGSSGLVLPANAPTRDEANAILAQLISTRGLRELTSREKEAVRVLRRQGIRQPAAPAEFAAIANATLRRRSKAAKRARHAQRIMEGNRAALQRLAGEVAC